MGLLLQTLTFGVLVGSLYALASSGLALTYGVLRIVNLVHGSLLIAGGYVTYTVWAGFGIDPILSVPISALTVGALGGALYLAFVRTAAPGGEGGIMMATFALMIAGQGIFALVWGNTPLTVSIPYTRASFRVGDLTIPQAQLYAAVAAVIALVILVLLLQRTKLGRSIRAAAANPAAARFVGIDVKRVNALTYMIGSASAGAAGALVSLVYPLSPDAWTQWLGRCLAIVVLGGLGSMAGTFLAALVLGVAETLTTAYISLGWTTAVPYFAILLVLILRPAGILGRRGRTDMAPA